MSELNVRGASRRLVAAGWWVVVIGIAGACANGIRGVENPVALLFVGIFSGVFVVGLLLLLCSSILKTLFQRGEKE